MTGRGGGKKFWGVLGKRRNKWQGKLRKRQRSVEKREEIEELLVRQYGEGEGRKGIGWGEGGGGWLGWDTVENHKER